MERGRNLRNRCKTEHPPGGDPGRLARRRPPVPQRGCGQGRGTRRRDARAAPSALCGGRRQGPAAAGLAAARPRFQRLPAPQGAHQAGGPRSRSAPLHSECPWDEVGGALPGRAPQTAAAERDWCWPSGPGAPAWHDRGRFLVYKMLYWDF